MSKKLVWIGVVMVLSIVILSSSIYAYQYRFRISPDYCYADVDGTYSATSDTIVSFTAEFFEKYSDNGFSTDYSTPDIEITTGNGNPPGCFHSSSAVETGEKLGWFAYGYLYTQDTLTTSHFRVSSYCNENWETFNTKAPFAIYDISNYPRSGSFETYVKSVTPSVCVRDSAVRDNANTASDWNYADSSCTLNLQPGAYFVAVGLVGEIEGTIHQGNRFNVGSGLNFARFDAEEASVYNALNTNRMSNLAGYPKYVITDTLLKPDEINLIFKGYVENTSGLCHAAGGQMLTEYDASIGADFEAFKSAFSTYNPGKQFDMTHLCCGNTEKETYSFNYDTVEGIQTFYCSDKTWSYNTNAGECARLINTNTEWDDHADDSVWEDEMNLFNLEYYEIDTDRIDGSDGCCGDDYPPTSGYGDYGYIGTVDDYDRFLCYDSNMDPTNPQFDWLDAFDDRYLIKTMNKGSTAPYNSVDLISNSQEWYYCNANGKNLFNAGIRMPEYGTFGNVDVDDMMACSDIASIIYLKDDTLYEKCDNEEYNLISNFPCCRDETPVSIFTPTDCAEQCYDATGGFIGRYSDEQLCNDFHLGCPLGSTDDDLTDLELDKSVCPSDPDAISCLNVFASNPALPCSAQVLKPGYNYSVCTSSQLCGNGTFVASNETNIEDRCCVGVKTYCKDVEEAIPTPNDCLEQFGQVYSREQYNCFKPGGIPIANTGLSCCFGTLAPTASFAAQLRTAVTKNTSFICFSQENQDVISNCCYDDNCKNIALVRSDRIRDGDNRVQALGGTLHTLENFDIVRDGMIIDRIKKYEIPEASSILYKDISTINLNLSHFSYLEFDIEYSIPLNVSINNYNMGPLSQYLTNGDSPSRRHHAVIPILKDSAGKPLAGDIVSKIRLVAHNKPAQFLIDNIILTPEGTDLQYNSQNYYCSGGFEGWISDLDPPTSWTNTQLQDWNQYGVYAMTCNSQSAFGWTGTMCCGDDTRFNYGEFYNDTLYGCFNGTIIKNDWSMGYAKNYYESTIENDQLDDYEYAGIMYYNNAFIGCQIPNGDAELSVSEYGTPETDLQSLVNNITNVQCAVVGKYHCDDGAWRQLIATDTGIKTFPGDNMSLKYAPSGAELIKIGFRPGELSAQTYDVPEGVTAETPPPAEEPDVSGEIEPITEPVVDTGLIDVPSCDSNQILCNNVCEPKFKDCTSTIPYATSAYQTGTCTGTTVTYGTCTLYSCRVGYKVLGNDCIQLIIRPILDDGGGGGSTEYIERIQ